MFDPHPNGCPVGLRVTPDDMPDMVTALCVKLRDVLHASIFVINPSKGMSYPVLFLYADVRDAVPRVAVFPGWEDGARSPKRRIDWTRQTTLLQRIREAGVPGESLESYRGEPSDRFGPGPLMLPLAVTAAQAEDVMRDLFDRLGALLRMTLQRIPLGKGRPDLLVMRIYLLDDERRPRVVLYPGWLSEGETEELDRERLDGLLQRAVDQRIPEVPLEAVF